MFYVGKVNDVYETMAKTRLFNLVNRRSFGTELSTSIPNIFNREPTNHFGHNEICFLIMNRCTTKCT